MPWELIKRIARTMFPVAAMITGVLELFSGRPAEAGALFALTAVFLIMERDQ